LEFEVRTVPPEELTRLLNGIDAGANSEELYAFLSQELRRIAHARLQVLKAGETLHPTALVNEAYLRLFGGSAPKVANRKHFFCLAAEAMRCIIVESFRRKHSLKRGGGIAPLELTAENVTVPSATTEEVLGVHDALEALAADHPQSAELVKLRYFAGLEMAECARLMEISDSTAQRYWRFARIYLRSKLE